MLLLLLLTTTATTAHSPNTTLPGEEVRGSGRNIPIFNVISFPNSACAATTGFNGTCYTASECTSKGGSAG